MELRTDSNVTSTDATATLADVYDLHDAEPRGATGDGVTVAVMDTGVDDDHPVFAETDVEHHDFTGAGTGDQIGHGTAVAGLVAQLAPDARIVSLRVFADSGQARLGPIESAYDWLVEAADEVDLCNVSWGASSTVERIDDYHAALTGAGIQDVVAAGNTGGAGGSPATAPGAFSVGAVTTDGDPARFSSYDATRDNPDVAALGRNVRLPRASGTSLGRVIDDSWVRASGTSFAAPVVTGLAARFRSAVDADVAKTFEATARDVPSTPTDGGGIVDYARARGARETVPTADAMAWDFLGTDVVHVSADWFPTGTYTARKIEEGTIELTQQE